MKTRYIVSAVLCLFTLLNTYGKDKVIYGDDDRHNMHDYSKQHFKTMARSTAAQISNENIVFNEDFSEYLLVNTPLKEQRGFCSDVRFLNQNAVAECSGFLISPTILVTAAHCMTAYKTCSRSKWVFNYNQKNIAENKLRIKKENVYSCELIDYVLDDKKSIDYAVVKLDRPVLGRAPLKVKLSGDGPAVGESILVIGHPSGLPTKISDNAQVRDNSHLNYFVTNLDTFGGNSGSAVLNLNTGLVEGILVKGETDYVYDTLKGCYLNKKCDDTSCRGEDVTKISIIKNLESYLK